MGRNQQIFVAMILLAVSLFENCGPKNVLNLTAEILQDSQMAIDSIDRDILEHRQKLKQRMDISMDTFTESM